MYKYLLDPSELDLNHEYDTLHGTYDEVLGSIFAEH